MIYSNPFRWADPTTWPWGVFVWLLLLAAGFLKPLGRWIQRNRASSWPTAIGQIDSVSVNQQKRPFVSMSPRGRPASYVAELRYSYSVAGTSYSGAYRRDFEAEDEAYEFIRDLKGKPVSVHNNPNKPSSSTLSESSIETLHGTRTPKLPDENNASPLADSIPPWFKPFLWPFIGLSAIGLVLSLWVHVGALMGRRVVPEQFFWMLHMGIFVVWIPIMLAVKQRSGNLNSKNYWKTMLKGAPDWMRYMTYGFLAYALVNFITFLFQAPSGGTGGNPPAIVWRGFSGHWMAFYSAAFATLYSAAHASEKTQRCLNGHPVPQNSNFCTRCGQPVMHV